ncbi:GntR family transcriptional regulator [Arthrobacter castelli]|uniref:GntR family transcriptional regulator n=1 Tax=Arthrobacter castelli TaxID=271431 RepID=UPI00040349CE|nr:GntR family transcriptional regulator [Arthrobacter castelli]
MASTVQSSQQGTRKKSTDSAAVVAGLRESISRGELVPNQRLIETDISHEFNASRATVRAALAELTTEGLVERIQNRGARVRAVSVAEAVEIIEVRGALEGICAAKAAELVTDEDIDELRTLARTMTEAVTSGDLLQYSEWNKTLHRRIVELSGQQTAAGLISRLRGQNVRHQFRLVMQPGRPSVSLSEHVDIIDAVCARDPQRAAAVMEQHLQSVADAIVKASDSPRQ